MVNTSIYGTPEQWDVANLGTSQNHADRKDSFLTAHFGGGGNTLENGYGYGIDLNTPIDKSLSYCGLGGFSTWSKIEYYKRNRDLELIGKDNRAVTNFSFNQAVKIATMTGIWYAENTSWTSTRYGSRCRFAPNAINSSDQGNYNNGFIPIVQIPIKNCILVPIFRVAKQINTDGTTTGMDVATVNCWDYYGTTATRNHNTHPYILGIGFQFYTKTTDSSSTRSGVSSSTSAILDELALYKNVPVDLQRPDQNVLSGGYSYCWNVPQSSFSYKHIFGYVNNGAGSVSNAIDYRVNDLPSSTRSDLLKAVAIFPHENAVFSDEWAVNTTTYARYYYLKYYDNLREWVRKQLACFGLFFTDVSLEVAQSGAFDSDDMFLGILDDNNIGQGVYSSGEDNRNQKQWNWETTNDSEYGPSGGGGGGEPYGDSTSFIKASGGINPGGKWYADDNLSTWNGLLSWCNGLALEGDDKLDKSLFYGQNPIDCIIEGKYIFVNDYTFGKTMGGTHDPISLGSYSGGGVNSYAFTSAYPKEFNCGFVDIDRPWGDFRDYEPYTTITLILPFADSIDLPTDIFMGHRCNLTEVIDPLTGDLIYYVFVDYILYTSLTGNCAMDLSINGLETATYAQTRFALQTQANVSKINSIASLIGGASGASIAAAMHNPGGAAIQALGGLANFAAGQYQAERLETQMSRTAPPPAKIQKASSNVQWGSMPYPHIVVASPLMVDGYSDTDYKTQTGFATYKVGKIGDEKGYVVCSSVNPSGLSCSKEEAEMITRALTQGIYIK